MSKSTHTLNVTKDNTTYNCDLYTTTEEAAVYSGSSYLPVNVNDTQLYAPLYPTTYSQVFYDRFGTPVHIKKNKTEYILATHSLIRLRITPVAHQTITVTAGGETWTSGDKWFPYGTTWSATIAADTGWDKGTLDPGSSGTLTNQNVTVTAVAAGYKTYTITLTQKTGETVTLYYKNHNGTSLASSWSSTTSSITLGHGSQYYSTIAGSTYYTAGTITSPGTSSSPNTLTGAVTISFTAATHITYKITLTQKSNETVTIHYKNHSGSALASSWSTTTSTITLGKGSQYYSTIAGSTYYSAGTITSPGSSSSPNTLNGNVTIAFGAATHITYKITLTQKANETVTIHYRNHSGSALGSWATTTGAITLGKGSQYYSTISANTGYNAGSITSPGSSSSPNTLNGNVTIAFGAASAKTYALKWDTSPALTVKKTNSSGAAISNGAAVAYNTTVYVQTTSTWDHYSTKVYKGTSTSGTLWYTKTTRSFTFVMPTSAIYMDSLSYDDCNCGDDS